MEHLLSLRIDDTAVKLVEGVHTPSPGGAGHAEAGKTASGVDIRRDGWIDAIISLEQEAQSYEWLLKECIHLRFTTPAGEYDFPNANVHTKEEHDKGVRILADYIKGQS